MAPASQQARDAATAGVITRPPFLYLACLILGLALEHLLPLPLTLPGAAVMQWTVGGGLILIGVAIVAGRSSQFLSRGDAGALQPACPSVWSQPAYTAGAAIRSMSACFSSMPASA